MNDPQSFLRGKLIHGPGAWLMSPSPLRQWVTPTILYPVSTSGASLLAMRIVQPVCEASRCCPRWPSSPPCQALTRRCTRWGRPGHTLVRTEGDKPHNWARAGPRLPSSATARAIYISTTFPPRNLTKTQQQLHFVAHWQVHFPHSQKTNHCKFICSTTWISQVHFEKSLIICAIAVEAKILKRL